MMKKLLKITKTAMLQKNVYFPNYYISQNPKILIAQIEDCVKILCPISLIVKRNKPSTSPKMIIKMYFNFFRFFLKVLELFEFAIYEY